MTYDKNQNATRGRPSENDRKRQKKDPPKKHGVHVGRILLGILLTLVVIAGAAAGYLYYKTPELDLDAFTYSQNAQILDCNGEPYQYLQGEELRENVEITQMPPILRSAFIAIEDQRFYSHHGVDLRGVARAVVDLVRYRNLDGVGGSTITQQLIKLTQLSSERTIERKFYEIIMAYRLEESWTKDQILEAYLNKINLGGVHGVQAAANQYFDCEVSELDTAQSCILAAIAKSPVYYSPYCYDENDEMITNADGSPVLSEDNRYRAGLVLDKLLSLGYIDQGEYDRSLAELDAGAGLTYVDLTPTYSYFTDSVYSELLEDLKNTYNYTTEQADSYIQTAGLKIYATVDPQAQAVVEACSQEDAYYPAQSAEAAAASAASGTEYIPQSGMTLIDNRTGAVLAIAGGRGDKPNLSINRASESFPTGSSTKPLTAYGPGLQTGTITLASVYNDTAISWNGWTPQNADLSYQGPISIRKALSESVNTVAAQVVADVGIDKCASFARKLGLELDDEDTQGGAALALGGYHTGQSTVQMAAAFSTFARGGEYIEPYFYTKVIDQSGNVILEHTVDPEEVFSEETSYLITSALEDVCNGGSTNVSVAGTQVAGKTGTTDQETHAWFCGYTPDYSMAVWYGYDENYVETESGNYTLNIGIFGGSKPGPALMFEAVMNQLSVKTAGFTQPSGVITAEIDGASGLLPSELTDYDPRGSQRTTELFAVGTVPTTKDNLHVSVSVCSQSGLRASYNCSTTSKVLLDLSQIHQASGITYTGGYQDLEKYASDSLSYCSLSHTSSSSSSGSSTQNSSSTKISAAASAQ